MINFPKTITYYYDKPQNSHNPLPQASLVPCEDTPAVKTKITKLSKILPNIGDFDNEPCPGFYIASKDWSVVGGETWWWIADPRGFLAKVSSKNLESIFHSSYITNGVIQSRCAWARDNNSSSLFLVNENSPEFAEAQKNSEILENKIDVKSVDIGDTVLTQSGVTGVYMGSHTLYTPMVDTPGSNNSPCLAFSSKARRQIIKIGVGKYFYQSDVKILKVISKALAPMTKESAADLMNREIDTITTLFTTHPNLGSSINSYFTYKSVIRKVFPFSTVNQWIDIEPIDRPEAEILFNKSLTCGDASALMLEDALGKKYIIDYPMSLYFNGLTNFSINSFPIIEVLSIQTSKLLLASRRSASNYSSKKKLYDLSFFVKFYKINKHIKDNIYV